MKKIAAVLVVGLWLTLSGAGSAQEAAPADPGLVPAAFRNCQPSATHWDTCPAPNYPGCNPGCNAPAACAAKPKCGCCCLSKLWNWLCYKPLPVPCACQHCCHCGGNDCCTPPVYMFFLHVHGPVAPCQNGSCGNGSCVPGAH